MAKEPLLSVHAFERAVQKGIPMDAALVAYATKCAALFTDKPQKFSFGEYSIVGAINRKTREPTIITVYWRN